MSAVLEILVQHKLNQLKREDALSSEETALGQIVAAYLRYDRLRILSAVAAALEDAALLREAEEVRAMCLRLLERAAGEGSFPGTGEASQA